MPFGKPVWRSIIRRDLALVVDDSLPHKRCSTRSTHRDRPSDRAFSVRCLPRPWPDRRRKSLAILVLMQDTSRTLTDAEIDATLPRWSRSLSMSSAPRSLPGAPMTLTKAELADLLLRAARPQQARGEGHGRTLLRGSAHRARSAAMPVKLVGLRQFSAAREAAAPGRNPKTGEDSDHRAPSGHVPCEPEAQGDGRGREQCRNPAEPRRLLAVRHATRHDAPHTRDAMQRSSKAELPPIPAKRYFTIGEVSDLCAVKPHVLAYWEQEFAQLKPVKRRGEPALLPAPRGAADPPHPRSLYEQGFTINGARHRLESEVAPRSCGAVAPTPTRPPAPAGCPPTARILGLPEELRKRRNTQDLLRSVVEHR